VARLDALKQLGTLIVSFCLLQSSYRIRTKLRDRFA
jgi:hypothetical protein